MDGKRGHRWVREEESKKTIWIFMTDEAVAKRWREGRGREQGYVRKT